MWILDFSHSKHSKGSSQEKKKISECQFSRGSLPLFVTNPLIHSHFSSPSGLHILFPWSHIYTGENSKLRLLHALIHVSVCWFPKSKVSPGKEPARTWAKKSVEFIAWDPPLKLAVRSKEEIATCEKVMKWWQKPRAGWVKWRSSIRGRTVH